MERDITDDPLARDVQQIGAHIEVLKAAVFALASTHPNIQQLLLCYDAATTVLDAKEQGSDKPEAYVQHLAHLIPIFRKQLELAATPSDRKT